MPVARTWWRDGIMVGLIASAAVALFYGAFDLLATRGPFFTASLLGRALFDGLRDPAVLQFPMAPDLTAVALYSVVHIAASLAIGLAVVWLVERAARAPARDALTLAVIVAGFAVTVIAIRFLAAPIRELLPTWSVVTANALATLCAGSYLLATRPGLWRRLLR